jgi:hypothetical protein
LAAVAMATLLSSACGQYLFQQSDRLEIVQPKIYSTVREPLTLAWRAHDFQAPRDGSFVVFVDRDPMPPGESLDYFARDDREGIHVLDATTLSLGVLTQRVGVDPAERNHHDVTVVLVDRSGRRVGEYAGFTEFTVVRS